MRSWLINCRASNKFFPISEQRLEGSTQVFWGESHPQNPQQLSRDGSAQGVLAVAVFKMSGVFTSWMFFFTQLHQPGCSSAVDIALDTLITSITGVAPTQLWPMHTSFACGYTSFVYSELREWRLHQTRAAPHRETRRSHESLIR